MSVRDAEVGDIYVERDGKLWRVIATCAEPTVHMEEVESSVMNGQKCRKLGGISGAMWNGMERVYRKPKAFDGTGVGAATISRAW